jgi:hypothetical protein
MTPEEKPRLFDVLQHERRVIQLVLKEQAHCLDRIVAAKASKRTRDGAAQNPGGIRSGVCTPDRLASVGP